MNRLILLAGLLGLAASGFADTLHTFIYRPSDHPRKVDIAGTFNNWSDTANPMQQRMDGSFAATLLLPDGIYQYKFVINGNDWKPDPNSDKELETPGDPDHNSAVFVGTDARHAPTPPPNKIVARWVMHHPADASDVNVATPHLVRLRLRTLAKNVDSVSVELFGRQTAIEPMYKVSTSMGLDTWACFVQTNQKQLDYVFELHDGTSAMDETPTGLIPFPGTRGESKGKGIQLPIQNTDLATQNAPSPQPSPGVPGEGVNGNAFHVDIAPAFETPDWAQNAVWYQIFPERFRNGDPANDPPHTQRWQSQWSASLPGEAPGQENFYQGAGNIWKRRYGGDVQGLIWALPYLKSLGITAIYLNPMFEADSLHKYDTSDYRHIDEHFGFAGDIEQLQGETEDPKTWQWTKTDKLFLDFVAQAHAMGFKVVLDGVFNHVGRDFWAFQDVLKNGKNSKYAKWFDIRDWSQPIKYIAWDRGDTPSDDGALPIFKKDARLGLVHGPREHVLAIARRWLAPDGDPARGIDGFRLDVANDVPHPFWQEFRKELKTIKPDCYISGEIWTWAQPWLKGNEFDAVMNYRFALAMQDFYVRQKAAITPTQFNDRLNEMIYAYPLQIALDQMNLLDSHDTDRFASMIVNSDLPFKEDSRLQDKGGEKYSISKPDPTQLARMEQALVTQFTFLGAPMIYYGDEAGMWSADDPSNRQPMVWKDLQPYDDPQVTFNQKLFNWYQRLIAIRNSFPPLRTGFYRPVLMDNTNGVFVYARDLGDYHIYIAVNRSPAAHTVTFAIDPSIRQLNDYLNRSDMILPPFSQTGRPQIRPNMDEKYSESGGQYTIKLPPWGSAILR